jgi:hypothetical protein
VSGISYLSIFRPLLVVNWVLAKKVLKVNGVYTAWDLVYRAMGT